MLEEVDGFILTEMPYKESSKIINVLTKEYGIIGIIAKGAASLKNKNRVATMRLSYAKFNIYYKKDKLSTLVSADIINPLKNIRSDIFLISYISYITELTYQVYKQSESKEIYDNFITTVLKIEDGLDPLVLTNILEIKYLEKLGVLFDLDECVFCKSKQGIATISADAGGFVCQKCLTNEVLVTPKVIKMIRMYYYINIESIKDIKVEESIKKTINTFLDIYYEKYTGLYLNSKNFLKSIDKQSCF